MKKNKNVVCVSCHANGLYKDFIHFGDVPACSKCADKIQREINRGHEPTIFDFVRKTERRRPLDSALAWAA